ncbi:MAG TPA: NTF2-like N-terminal transpeptidase domain-containing protein, partial [Anaerolineae bacterium]
MNKHARMIKHALWITCLLFVVGCSSATPTPPPTPTAVPTTAAPAPEATVDAFLSAWQKADFNSMFNLISIAGQAGLTPDTFANRYHAAQATAGVTFVRAAARSVLRSSNTAKVGLHVEWDTVLFGTLSTDNEMTLALQNNQWRVSWNDDLIWPGLKDGGLLQIEYQIPRRANIYDRDGKGLAVDGKIVTVGVVPGQIEDEAKLLDGLSPIVGMIPEDIKAKYASAR